MSSRSTQHRLSPDVYKAAGKILNTTEREQGNRKLSADAGKETEITQEISLFDMFAGYIEEHIEMLHSRILEKDQLPNSVRGDVIRPQPGETMVNAIMRVNEGMTEEKRKSEEKILALRKQQEALRAGLQALRSGDRPKDNFFYVLDLYQDDLYQKKQQEQKIYAERTRQYGSILTEKNDKVRRDAKNRLDVADERLKHFLKLKEELGLNT